MNTKVNFGKTSKRGFTLVELLIVIGILAILATAAILVLNPAQMLAQARDSQRMSDLSSVKSAIALYLTTATSPNVTSSQRVTATTTGPGCPFSQGVCSLVTSTAIDSTGWASVDLSQTSGGSSLSALPNDPTNSGVYFYAFSGSSTPDTFELNAHLESTKYEGQMTTDGGDKNTCTNVNNNYATETSSTCWYETGTDPGLNT